MDNERISDPRLAQIMEQAPPTHVGKFLRFFFGIERGPVRVRSSVEKFCADTGTPEEEIRAVLEERELLTQSLSDRLDQHLKFGPGFFLRLQKSAYLDYMTLN